MSLDGGPLGKYAGPVPSIIVHPASVRHRRRGSLYPLDDEKRSNSSFTMGKPPATNKTTAMAHRTFDARTTISPFSSPVNRCPNPVVVNRLAPTDRNTHKAPNP